MRLFNPEYFPAEWRISERPDLFAGEFVISKLGNTRLLERDVSEFGLDPDLFDTPIYNLCKYLTSESDEFERLSGMLGAPSTNRAESKLLFWAIDRLLGGLDDIREHDLGKDVYQAIIDWSTRWNLCDRWCQEFALDVLVHFRIEIERFLRRDVPEVNVEHLIDPSCPTSFWIASAWQSGVWDLSKRSFISSEIAISRADDSSTPFSFEFRDGQIMLFELTGIWSPFRETKNDFRSRMKSQFLNLLYQYLGENMEAMSARIDDLARNIRRFSLELSSYINCALKSYHDGIAQPIPSKASGDRHFRWLLEYQFSIDSSKTISDRVGVGRKTFEDGIKDAAKMLGLTLRTPRRGRPKGVQENSIHRGANRVK
jgi:hypothetical protein